MVLINQSFFSSIVIDSDGSLVSDNHFFSFVEYGSTPMPLHACLYMKVEVMLETTEVTISFD